MIGDKYTALWVSHSSINNFLHCPRAYYLNNVYKDPRTGHKITIISPPLALGQVVHRVLESLSHLPAKKRFDEPLMRKFEETWQKVSGKRGGFASKSIEEKYKNRGKEMLRKVLSNPGPLKNLSVKIREDLPYFWLSENENIILCGKIDWLEYLPDSDSVHIIDFKTGTRTEDPQSLQLPIYCLLANNCQKREVSKASYWYLNRSDKPSEKKLPDFEKAYKQVLGIAKKIKLARQLDRFKCPHKTGCRACKPLEAVIRKDAEFVGEDEFRQDVYVLGLPKIEKQEDSVIL